MRNAEIAAALRSLADAIERDDSGELSRALTRIPSRGRESRPTAKVKASRRAISKIDHSRIAGLADQLTASESRDRGLALLEGEALARNELLALANRFSVHVTKLDNIERIEEKIVETVIGSRLNSIAIRGA